VIFHFFIVLKVTCIYNLHSAFIYIKSLQSIYTVNYKKRDI